MALVHSHGHNGNTEVYDDWNRSGGRPGLGKRTAYKRLCDDIEADQIGPAVYLNALDRGGRDLEEMLRFCRVAREHGTEVIDQTGDWTAADRIDELESEATFAGREYRKAVKRSAFGHKIQADRGDTFGHPPYGLMMVREWYDDKPPYKGHGKVTHVPNPDEPIGPILDAIRETRGNVLAACRLLNSAGSTARYGRPWAPRTLANIVRREEPRLLRQKATTRTGPTGLRQPAPLARLVLCHCGHLMTPRVASNSLYCGEGIKFGPAIHGRYVARDRHVYALLEWLTEGQREVKSSRTYTSADPDPADARREELTEWLRRLGVSYRAGTLTDEEFEEDRQTIAAELDALIEEAEDAAEELINFTVRKVGKLVNWDADPAKLGDELRRVFRSVTLDEDMLPASVEWRLSQALIQE